MLFVVVCCCCCCCCCCCWCCCCCYLIASRIPPGQGKELIRNFVNLSMGWWVDGLMGSLGGLGVPLGGQRGAKGSQTEPKWRAKGAKREPKGSQNGDKVGPKVDLGSQWGPRAKRRGPRVATGGPTVAFARSPGPPGGAKHSKSVGRYCKNRCWCFFVFF